MRSSANKGLRLLMSATLLASSFALVLALPGTNLLKRLARFSLSASALASSNFSIQRPDNKSYPVVNVGGRIQLSVVDSSGQKLTSGVTFRSDSTDIASVDQQSGTVAGMKEGFATIIAE